jgi:hypothetical protein
MAILLPEQRRQARSAAGRGLAADAGIDHLARILFVIHALLQQLHPALAARQAVFGAQRIAKHQHRAGPAGLAAWAWRASRRCRTASP